MGKKNKLHPLTKALVKKYLDDLDGGLEDSDGYKATKFGEGRVSSFEIKGLINSFAMVAEWPTGEGYDISIETALGKNLGWETKKISIHLDELECVLRAINDLDKK